MNKLTNYYKEKIYETLDFWYKFGYDQVNGGFYTYLTNTGSLYSKEKSVWAQGRGLYIFSLAYNNIEKKEDWLNCAIDAYNFLKNKCFDKDERMFFIVTNDGKGFQKRRYYYSETFMVIGALELYKATNNKEYFDFGMKVYNNLLSLINDKDKQIPKFNPEVFNAITLASPMILLSTTQIVREVDKINTNKYNELIDGFFQEIKLHKRGNQSYILLET